ncbi:MAG: hypothetical protein WA622_02060 [Mycobacterium sp.]|uniref:hypothetical protein n=1 Tax=Mycobacterium sp. TaxID=1785 RepID=UPI003BB6A9B8
MATYSQHRGSARSPRTLGGRELVVAVGWAALLVVIVVLSAWAHHSLSPARQASPHAAAAQPAISISPPLPALPVGPQLRAWFTDAKPSITAMFIAADNFVTAARYGDVAGAGAACQTAADALAKLQHHTPSPDPALNTKLQQAITNYQAGIRHCVAGKQDREPAETGKAMVSISQGSTDLQAAVGIIEEDLATEARDQRVWTA